MKTDQNVKKLSRSHTVTEIWTSTTIWIAIDAELEAIIWNNEHLRVFAACVCWRLHKCTQLGSTRPIANCITVVLSISMFKIIGYNYYDLFEMQTMIILLLSVISLLSFVGVEKRHLNLIWFPFAYHLIKKWLFLVWYGGAVLCLAVWWTCTVHIGWMISKCLFILETWT